MWLMQGCGRRHAVPVMLAEVDPPTLDRNRVAPGNPLVLVVLPQHPLSIGLSVLHSAPAEPTRVLDRVCRLRVAPLLALHVPPPTLLASRLLRMSIDPFLLAMFPFVMQHLPKLASSLATALPEDVAPIMAGVPVLKETVATASLLLSSAIPVSKVPVRPTCLNLPESVLSGQLELTLEVLSIR